MIHQGSVFSRDAACKRCYTAEQPIKTSQHCAYTAWELPPLCSIREHKK